METEMLNFYVRGATGCYEKPSPANLERAEQLFEQLLQSRAVSSDASKQWSSLGFTVKKVSESDTEFAVVSECPKSRGRGNGFYVVKLLRKVPSSSPIVLQAVHTPSDLHTHKVAFKLLMESNVFIAAGWNTRHRETVDLGKERMSYFNSFTAAVARSFLRPRVVQLHAFDANSHKINGDMILSSSRAPGCHDGKELEYQKLVSSMRAGLKQFVILHFPKDIQVLGGTLNVNAKVFYENNPEGLFYHVEMSMPLRLEMRDQQETRKSFIHSFL